MSEAPISNQETSCHCNGLVKKWTCISCTVLWIPFPSETFGCKFEVNCSSCAAVSLGRSPLDNQTAYFPASFPGLLSHEPEDKRALGTKFLYVSVAVFHSFVAATTESASHQSHRLPQRSVQPSTRSGLTQRPGTAPNLAMVDTTSSCLKTEVTSW